MKLVYCHNREYAGGSGLRTRIGDKEFSEFGVLTVSPRGGSTVAMEAIQSWLLDNLQQGDTIVRKVGIAMCSDEDNYCRKTGREIAQSRLKQTTLTVVNLVKFGEFVIVFFEDEIGNLFEVKKTSDPYCARLVRMLDD